MTPEEKHIFNLFPENEVVRQQDIIMKYLKPVMKKPVAEKGFLKIIKRLQKTKVIEYMDADDDGVYLRRRTVEEIRNIYFNQK